MGKLFALNQNIQWRCRTCRYVCPDHKVCFRSTALGGWPDEFNCEGFTGTGWGSVLSRHKFSVFSIVKKWSTFRRRQFCLLLMPPPHFPPWHGERTCIFYATGNHIKTNRAAVTSPVCGSVQASVTCRKGRTPKKSVSAGARRIIMRRGCMGNRLYDLR